MQRYHDPSTDPLPLRSAINEAERQRLQQLTEAFLGNGGEIEQVGFQMKDKYTFVIDASRSPVYAHLFQKAAEPPKAQPKAAPAEAPARSPEPAAELPVCLIRAWAVLGYTPKQMADRLEVSEKTVRQACRDHSINVRQR